MSSAEPGGRAPMPLAGGVAALRGVLARPLASYYLLVSSAGLLLVIGLTMVFSATSVKAYAEDGNAFAAVSRQAVYALVGIVGFWVCQRLPARTFRFLGYPLLVVTFGGLILLDLLLVLKAFRVLPEARLGPIYADELWLHLGPAQIQPSEFAKFALLLWGADVLARKGTAIVQWRALTRPLFLAVGLLFVLVGYNDFGSLVVLLALFVGMLWAAGVRLRVFAAMAGIGAVGLAALLALPGKSGYRLERLTSFSADPTVCGLRDCYQAVQAQYAIADGGWFGVGLGKASLKWGWLPAGHNDFIFAIVAEELGFVGCTVVLALLGVFAYTGLRIARRVADPFRRLAAAAAISWLVAQAFINIGGVIGLLPITGVPLPFISDGGSALVVTLAAVGMLASFARAEPDAARALHARPARGWVRILWAPLPPLGESGPAAPPRAPRPPRPTSGRSPAGTSRRGEAPVGAPRRQPPRGGAGRERSR
ncbi:putative peptidoglycan glycosyltransferase FtsW [Pilimelia columellifera]|uniref:Probable peptidoglycan glycosyltransferase FtsW n=1 Tax=Pilimelia columellifera subsp. columellifera TaxID=706583 RepID=A0ABP6AJU7_9ACTN